MVNLIPLPLYLIPLPLVYLLLFTVVLYGVFFLLSTLLFVPFRKRRPDEKLTSIELPKVSIVIAARNEYENLRKLLPALFGQSYPNFEVIIVSDRSTDPSNQWLRETTKRYPKQLKVAFLEDKPATYDGKKNALMYGIQKIATGEVLLLTDADCLPKSTQWIYAMIKPFLVKSTTKIVLGYSPYQVYPEALNHLIQLETLLTGAHYLASAELGIPYMGVGRNLAYRRDFFLEKGGLLSWITQTGGDDDLFVGKWATKNNTVTCYEGQTISEPKRKWKDFFRQKHRHLSVGLKYPLKNRLWVGLWQISYLGSLLSLFLTCIFLSESRTLLIPLLLFRYIYWGWLIADVKKRLNHSFPLYLIFSFELVYLVYYFLTGIYILFVSKHPTWTTNAKKSPFPKKH